VKNVELILYVFCRLDVGSAEMEISTLSYCRILNKHNMFKTIKSAGIILVCYLILATTGTKGQYSIVQIGFFSL